MDDRTEHLLPERESRDPQHVPDHVEQQLAYGGTSHPAWSLHDEGVAAAHAAEQNRLLRALPLEEYARVLPLLTPVRIDFRQLLVEPDVPIRHVYFPREGLCSIVADNEEGGVLEVGTVGRDGFIGMPVLHDAESMPYRVLAQIEGHAWRLSADVLRQVVAERRAVRYVLHRYVQYYTDQLSQSVACIQLHTLDERCARWLLMAHDCVEGDSFELTHELLSCMLGVRRAGVTVAMGALQAGGIVHYTRGHVTVQDRDRLEKASCGCYDITRNQFERLLG
jgi:CRP-like cAMP-binding protein